MSTAITASLIRYIGLCQLVSFFQWLDRRLSKEDFAVLVRAVVVTVVSVAGTAFLVLTVTGKIAPWTGR